MHRVHVGRSPLHWKNVLLATRRYLHEPASTRRPTFAFALRHPSQAMLTILRFLRGPWPDRDEDSSSWLVLLMVLCLVLFASTSGCITSRSIKLEGIAVDGDKLHNLRTAHAFATRDSEDGFSLSLSFLESSITIVVGDSQTNPSNIIRRVVYYIQMGRKVRNSAFSHRRW